MKPFSVIPDLLRTTPGFKSNPEICGDMSVSPEVQNLVSCFFLFRFQVYFSDFFIGAG